MTKPVEICLCGQALHYTDEAQRKLVKRLIRIRGPYVKVNLDGVTYDVPRHFMALHGEKELKSVIAKLQVSKKK